MSPEGRWKVVVAQVPKIPWRSPPTSEPDGAVASTSANRDVTAPSSSARAESSSSGGSGAILDALLVEFEPSSGQWSSNQWLQRSEDHPASPPHRSTSGTQQPPRDSRPGAPPSQHVASPTRASRSDQPRILVAKTRPPQPRCRFHHRRRHPARLKPTALPALPRHGHL